MTAAPTPIDDLIGRRIVEFRRAGHCWQLVAEGERVLTVTCVWRILVHGRVRDAETDDGQVFGTGVPRDALADGVALLVGRTIRDASHALDGGDLHVEVDDGIVFQAWSDSRAYESWDYRVEGEARLVCRGGGEVGGPSEITEWSTHSKRGGPHAT